MWSTCTCTSFAWPHCVIHVLSNHVSYAGTKWIHWMMLRSPLSQRPLYLSGPANEYGAAAPPTARAPAPTPARFSSSRLLRPFPADIPSSFLAERSAGEPCDEAVEERVVDERQRDARDEDRGHDRGPVEEVAPDQIGRDARRERALVRAGDERDGVDELVHHE